MPQFMMLYKGEATDMTSMTEAEVNEVMGQWRGWMGNVGAALISPGAPFGPSTSVVDDGSTGTAQAATGYSIVEAADLQAAAALAEGHPYLSEGKGNYAIDLFEMMPVPFQPE